MVLLGAHGPAAERRARAAARICAAVRVRRIDGDDEAIVIAAGGTAGHVVPALAVADALRAERRRGRLRRRRARRGRARARRRLRAATARASSGLSRTQPAQARRARRSRAAGAVRAARGGSCATLRPDAVLGGGGYVAGPVGLAAVLRPRPARARPRPTATSGSPTACSRRSRGASAWPSRSTGRDGDALPRDRPARAAAGDRPRRGARRASASRRTSTCVLVFGGSLGARSINEAAVEAFAGRAVPRAARRAASATSRRCAGRVPGAGYDLRALHRAASARRWLAADLVRRALGRLDLRGRRARPARDPRPLPARRRRPPDRATRAGWPTPAPRSSCPTPS